MKLEDFIRTDEYGERFVAGHRIPLLSILREHIEHGKDGRELAERFDTLNLEKIYGVLAYYYANQEEVDAYLQATEESIRKQREEYFRNYKGPTTEELRERLRKKQEEETAKTAS